MNVERSAASSSLIDVLDRVLDKGIVIDACFRLSVVGIDLISVEAPGSPEPMSTQKKSRRRRASRPAARITAAARG